MPIMGRTFAAAVLASAALAGTAWGAAASPAYDQCMAGAAGVTSAMRDCAAAEYGRQDRELNAVYRAAMARLDPGGRDRLRAQERAWLKRRTAQCRAAMAKDAGGTAALLDADSCTLDFTGRRIAELKTAR